jgi:hypothetical protein
MRSVRIAQLWAIMVVAAVPSAASEIREGASIEQVATAYDRAEQALENLKDASQSGDLEHTKSALTVYLRSLSGFHIKLVRQHLQRQESGFLKTLAPRLTSQITTTEALAEIAHPSLGGALNEATNHLRSALEFVDYAVNKKRGPSVKLSILGPESTNPGARAWPPYLLFGGTEPQFRIR